MEQKQNLRASPRSAEAATDGPVSSSIPAAAVDAAFAEPLVSECLADTFGEGSRKPRHDGWTPERIGLFLRGLAESGCVEDAAAMAGLSVQSAYAFRNRRTGRAFASMWDAILIHRSRARLAGVSMSRAIKGCVSVRKREGVVVEELHRPDTRLSMALLARLDRLAEKEAPNEEHLRTLSEDMDEFIACVEAGGDADAFVEQRRPPPPPKPPAPPVMVQERDPELDRFALLAGCHHYRDAHPFDIDVSDIDPTRRGEWSADQWVRAFRSGFMTWLDIKAVDPEWQLAEDAAVQFEDERQMARTEHYEQLKKEGRAAEIDTSDLHWDRRDLWSVDQWERAIHSGFAARMPDSGGEDASLHGEEEEEDEEADEEADDEDSEEQPDGDEV